MASAAMAQRVSIAWDASVSENIIGYNIYRSTTSQQYAAKLNSLPMAALTYVDAPVPGMKYYYVVTAVDNVAESAFSNEVQVQVPFPLIIHALSMQITDGGPLSTGQIMLWGNGSTGVADGQVFIPQTGNYKINVPTRGEWAQNVGPVMEVSLDGQIIGSMMVPEADVVFSVINPIAAGIHDLKVTFKNDYSSPTEDRNLVIGPDITFMPISAPPPVINDTLRPSIQ